MLFQKQSRNRFGLSELSGAVGDLGTALPLAFALVVFNGFPATRLFLLWGLIYIATGWYFKVPISVQPLKAMAVIAITAGFSQDTLATTAIIYGLLLLFLTGTGLVGWLQQWFSPALIRGVQLGIGLLLAQKAIALVGEHGFFLGVPTSSSYLAILLLSGVFLLLCGGQLVMGKPVGLFVLGAALVVGIMTGVSPGPEVQGGALLALTLPNWQLIPDVFILLILPQLPLTLGNAVFAANDVCHELWPGRSNRVTVQKLGGSIGISNIFIGLLGGFPICHGAGGITAHARLGGRTGGTTMILGVALTAVALVDGLSGFLFLIPVPVLGALLLLNSWAMISLIGRLDRTGEWIVALTVGGISIATHHLAVALMVGLILERILLIRPVQDLVARMQHGIKVSFRR
ncbi:MAG: putative sulfate/molybdate transporter [Fidelibacterota bacterium]|nr:MAG: putative sulfate/molybdate transporter [Candidatus Neomarinimicrobiota bacterium]